MAQRTQPKSMRAQHLAKGISKNRCYGMEERSRDLSAPIYRTKLLSFCGNFDVFLVTLICYVEETRDNKHQIISSFRVVFSNWPPFPMSYVWSARHILLNARADQKLSVCFIFVQLAT